MIRSIRLQHMGIKVRDLDRAIKFYSEVLGFKLRSRHEAGSHPAAPFGSAFMYLDDYHHQLAIFSVPEGWVDSEGEDTVPRHDVGLHHLAFEVADQAGVRRRGGLHSLARGHRGRLGSLALR